MTDSTTTVSVVFDPDINCAATIESTTDPNAGSNELTDPDAPVEALQRLRILKTRETGDSAQVLSTTGRRTGNPVDLSLDSYADLAMRRKVEVLKYNKNTVSRSKKDTYARYASGIKTSSSYSYKRLQSLVEQSVNCATANSGAMSGKKAYNSGIRGDNSILLNNNKIPYYSSL